MSAHVVKWRAPSPLWRGVAAASPAARTDSLARPALLRYASDAFMDEFLQTLATDPERLADRLVQEETWRGVKRANVAPRIEKPGLAQRFERLRLARRRGAPPPTRTALAAGEPYKLKLYQAAHQRYYLVTASLACDMAGLPDREVDAGRGERVGFVLRRLFPVDVSRLDASAALPPYDPAVEEGDDATKRQWREYAFVAGPSGPRWQPLDDAGVTVPGEERLPLFPAGYTDDREAPRRLFAGLVPTGRREQYFGTARLAGSTPTPADEGEDPRVSRFRMTVLGPWKGLVARAEQNAALLNAPLPGAPPSTAEPMRQDAKDALLLRSRGETQTNAWYLLIDLADFLAEHAADALKTTVAPDTKVEALRQALLGTVMPAALRTAIADGTSAYRNDVPPNLHAALVKAVALSGPERAALEAQTMAFAFPAANAAAKVAGWPGFLFLIADATQNHALPNAPAEWRTGPARLEQLERQIDWLAEKVREALPAKPREELPPAMLAAQPAPDLRGGWFVIRCVYERPECGPLHPTVLSAPTAAFDIAGFFDPDAPARPIRIGLPIDTSPAGLRKFDKNTAFMVSDILCGQIDRAKALSFGDLVMQVLPWPFHKGLSVPERGPCTEGGNPIGLMCSVSIPIITICALILLMIMVTLLDMIFRWLPYFILCFPIPGFKGKR